MYALDDLLYIGNGMEPKCKQHSHIKTVADWKAFFSEKLEIIRNEPDPENQEYYIVDLGYNHSVFCINPLTGAANEKNSFRSDDNVKEYRYVLVESDNLTRGQQVALMKGLKLPIVSMTFSGNRSIHGLVRVDALPGVGEIKNKSDWDQKIKNGLFSQIVPLGFDRVTSNPSRLSRLPGMWRPDKLMFQRLIYLKDLNKNKGDSNV